MLPAAVCISGCLVGGAESADVGRARALRAQLLHQAGVQREGGVDPAERIDRLGLYT